MIDSSNIISEFQNPKNWKKTNKKSSYEVYIGIPKIGTQFHNFLEDANYTVGEGQVVISGTKGEMWVTSIKNICNTYCKLNGEPITSEWISHKKQGGIMDWVKVKPLPNSRTCWAFHLPLSVRNFPVQTSWALLYANRDGKPHGKGDFIVAEDASGMPDLNNIRVVNGTVFPVTYNMDGFKGLTNEAERNVITPKPSMQLKRGATLQPKVIVEKLINELKVKGINVNNCVHDTASGNYADYNEHDLWTIIHGDDMYTTLIGFGDCGDVNKAVITVKNSDGDDIVSQRFASVNQGVDVISKVVPSKEKLNSIVNPIKQALGKYKDALQVTKIDSVYLGCYVDARLDIYCDGELADTVIFINVSVNENKITLCVQNAPDGNDLETDFNCSTSGIGELIQELLRYGNNSKTIDKDVKTFYNLLLSVKDKFGFGKVDLENLKQYEDDYAYRVHISKQDNSRIGVTVDVYKNGKVYAWVHDDMCNEVGSIDLNINNLESIKRFIVNCSNTLKHM